MQKTEKKLSMVSGSPAKSLIAFTIPLILGNLFQQFYNLIDSVVVGNYVGEGALAAVGIAAPFALEAALRRPDARACACIGVLVLIGGFFLRYCLCTAPFMDIASYL